MKPDLKKRGHSTYNDNRPLLGGIDAEPDLHEVIIT